jgi:hypothetical protein
MENQMLFNDYILDAAIQECRNRLCDEDSMMINLSCAYENQGKKYRLF